MRSIVTPLSVGLLTLIAAGFLVWGVLKVKKGLPPGVGTYKVFAYFDDASGLGPRTRVMLAGVGVGQVEDVHLAGNRAKVTLTLRTDAVLNQDAELAKRQASVLGDYYLELIPGIRPPPLKDGDEIRNVQTALGVDGLLRRLGGITATIDLVARDVQKVTHQVASVFGSEQGAGKMREILDQTAQIARKVNEAIYETTGKLNRILDNFRTFSGTLNRFTGKTADRVGQILGQVNDIAGQVRGIVGRSGGSIDRSFDQVRTTLDGVKVAVDTVNRSLGHIENVTKRVDEGKGLVGQLTNEKSEGIIGKSERLVEKAGDVVENIGETFEGVGEFIDPIIRLRPVLDLHTEISGTRGKLKNYVGLRLETKPDKYYLIELVDDPRGKTTFSKAITTSTSSRQDPVTETDTITTTDALKFTFMLAKQFGPTVWRFGIKESTGGIGLDFKLPKDFEINLDIFDFIGDDRPRLKAWALWHFYKPFYLAAGGDDILNGASRDWFVGLGLRFTDEDIKSLLLFAPRVGN